MAHFEIVKGYENKGIQLPTRATEQSAGYDLSAAIGGVIPSLYKAWKLSETNHQLTSTIYYEQVNDLLKMFPGLKPALIPTGLKCKMAPDEYLKIVARSSLPLKGGLIVANAEGIIDADYYGNENNDGHIFIQVLNFTPQDIEISAGTKLAQAILCKYYTMEDDNAANKRVGGFGSTT